MWSRRLIFFWIFLGFASALDAEGSVLEATALSPTSQAMSPSADALSSGSQTSIPVLQTLESSLQARGS